MRPPPGTNNGGGKPQTFLSLRLTHGLRCPPQLFHHRFQATEGGIDTSLAEHREVSLARPDHHGRAVVPPLQRHTRIARIAFELLLTRVTSIKGCSSNYFCFEQGNFTEAYFASLTV